VKTVVDKWNTVDVLVNKYVELFNKSEMKNFLLFFSAAIFTLCAIEIEKNGLDK
jgi:hypothetical protein